MPFYGWEFKSNEQKISYTCFDEYGNTSHPANIDVMYGIAKEQTLSSNGGKVKFTFKHILSQVVFKAKTQLENMEVEIKEIKIHNFRIGGTYTLPTGSATEGKWTLKELTDPTLKWGLFTVVTGKNIQVTSTVKDISEETPMLFVPQTLNAWQTNTTTAKTKADADAAHESYLEITCKIKQNGVYVFAPEGDYGTLYVPFGTTLMQGKRHIYTLIFGGGYDAQGQAILQPINFEAEVDTWKDANATDIDVNL